MKKHPPGLDLERPRRCPVCHMTAADWTEPDERGIRWTIKDIRREGCARCREKANRGVDMDK